MDLVAASLVAYRSWSTSSARSVAKKLSATALSQQSPLRLMLRRTPWARTRRGSHHWRKGFRDPSDGAVLVAASGHEEPFSGRQAPARYRCCRWLPNPQLDASGGQAWAPG